jgi:hypothetical protein
MAKHNNNCGHNLLARWLVLGAGVAAVAVVGGLRAQGIRDRQEAVENMQANATAPPTPLVSGATARAVFAFLPLVFALVGPRFVGRKEGNGFWPGWTAALAGLATYGFAVLVIRDDADEGLWLPTDTTEVPAHMDAIFLFWGILALGMLSWAGKYEKWFEKVGSVLYVASALAGGALAVWAGLNLDTSCAEVDSDCQDLYEDKRYAASVVGLQSVAVLWRWTIQVVHDCRDYNYGETILLVSAAVLFVAIFVEDQVTAYTMGLVACAAWVMATAAFDFDNEEGTGAADLRVQSAEPEAEGLLGRRQPSKHVEKMVRDDARGWWSGKDSSQKRQTAAVLTVYFLIFILGVVVTIVLAYDLGNMDRFTIARIEVVQDKPPQSSNVPCPTSSDPLPDELYRAVHVITLVEADCRGPSCETVTLRLAASHYDFNAANGTDKMMLRACPSVVGNETSPASGPWPWPMGVILGDVNEGGGWHKMYLDREETRCVDARRNQRPALGKVHGHSSIQGFEGQEVWTRAVLLGIWTVPILFAWGLS